MCMMSVETEVICVARVLADKLTPACVSLVMSVNQPQIEYEVLPNCIHKLHAASATGDGELAAVAESGRQLKEHIAAGENCVFTAKVRVCETVNNMFKLCSHV